MCFIDFNIFTFYTGIYETDVPIRLGQESESRCAISYIRHFFLLLNKGNMHLTLASHTQHHPPRHTHTLVHLCGWLPILWTDDWQADLPLLIYVGVIYLGLESNLASQRDKLHNFHYQQSTIQK